MITCKKCSAQYESHWHKLQNPEWCFACNHWLLQARNPKGAIRVGGRHYRRPDEGMERGACGMTIRWIDTGKVEELTGLWFQGEIPAVWHDALPDNAERVDAAIEGK